MEWLAARDRRTFEFTLPDASSRPSLPVYYSATILLGRQRAKAAAPAIMALLENPKKCPPDLASIAIVALGRIGDPAAADAIRPYLKVAEAVKIRDENTQFEVHWGVRTNAARALAALGDRSGVPVLIELLHADQSLLRDYAQRLLEEISGRHDGKDAHAWQQWFEAL
jgi:HEAT repeat protein